MQCTEFARWLEQEPDGPLSIPAAEHLDGCVDCRLLFDDLERIRLSGFQWADRQPAPPPRVWLALRAQLESEGLIREPEVLHPRRRLDWALRPALVGVSLSLVLAAGALLNVQDDLPGNVMRGSMIPSVSTPAPVTEELGRTLDSNLRRVMASLPAHRPSLTAALQQNLAIVDNMIATCEKSAREEPDNPMVREYLYGAYQQKAVLLSTAVERTTLEVR